MNYVYETIYMEVFMTVLCLLCKHMYMTVLKESLNKTDMEKVGYKFWDM